MALNKRKVLETARKHAQKGAKAKALKEYNKLLKADPRDAKLLLEVGDAYRRWGQAEEAIAQYGKVAQQYRQDGFDARAVAVFKQILNLDPKHYAAYVSLSELYQRMGLDSEAISALQTAADGYHKEGRKAEALDLLRQTAALDPTNTTSRLKVADLLRQEGMESEAISEYRAVAEELDNQGDREQVLVVLERILEINADDLDTLTSLTRNLMASGELDRAEVFAIRLLNVSAEPSQYELLMDLYSQGGNEAKLADATRGLAKLHRDRGDEETARTLMQRLPVEEVGSSSRMAVDVSEVAEPELEDDELLEEEPFLSLDDEAVSEPEPEPQLVVSDAEEAMDLETEAPQPGDPVDPAPLPEGDPDQLLAEANVYLRYGKRDQAIASLRGVLAQDPVHQAALEKLGEAYQGDGQNGPALEVWTQAATQAREAGDAEALSILKDQIAAIDPAAAEQLGSVEAVAVADEPASSEGGIELDLDVEVDLNLDTAIDEVAGSETQSGLSVDLDLEEPGSLDDGATESEDDEFEIELDDDAFELEVDVEVDVVGEDGETTDGASSSVTGGITESISASNEDEPGLDDDSVEFDFDVDELSSPGIEVTSGGSTTSAAKIAEELEEAEFYLAQDMYDEAEEILSRILALVPNHPSAMLRMGELAAARGEAPDLDLTAASSDEAGVDVAELTFNGVTEGLDEVAGPEAIEEIDVEIDVEVGDEVVGDADLDDVTSNDLADEELESEAALVDESAPIVEDDVSVDGTTDTTQPAEEDQDVSAKPTTGKIVGDDTSSIESEQDESGGGDSFDLREALADVLSDEDESTNSDEISGVLSTVEDGFGSIFSDFKKGVTATLDEGDFATRYDLGIAYREMGLFEDALGEFRFCLDSPERRFESLHLMGVCARDLLRFGDAVNHFEQALALPETPSERLAGVYFDLALAQQGAGDLERACASLRQTIETEADFPGAATLLAELESAGESSPKLAQPGEGFESFDELFEADDDEDGDDAMVEAVPVETYESFDDVVAEADVTEEATSSADSDDDTQSTTKSGRKKISFV